MSYTPLVMSLSPFSSLSSSWTPARPSSSKSMTPNSRLFRYYSISPFMRTMVSRWTDTFMANHLLLLSALSSLLSALNNPLLPFYLGIKHLFLTGLLVSPNILAICISFPIIFWSLHLLVYDFLTCQDFIFSFRQLLIY